MVLSLCLVISTIIAWFLVRPHAVVDSGATSDGAINPNEILHDQKSRLVQMLRDLELDYATAKTTSQDYEQTKGQLSAELASLLQQMDDAERRK